MSRTRAIFKQILRICKQDREQHTAEAIANKFYRCNHVKGFWIAVTHMNDSKTGTSWYATEINGMLENI
jgi:hypothetical protein